MKQLTRILLLAAGLAGGTWLAPDAGAQLLPLEISQTEIRYNLRKTGGLPISTVTNVPPGSDGRAPTLAQQQAAGLTEVPPTTNQFRGVILFGGSAKPGNTNLNPSLSYAANAENLNLARVKRSNQVVMILLRGRAAAPYLGRAVSYQFGEIVPRPDRDEFGVLLSTANTNVSPNRPVTTPEAYWLPEPYTTQNHTNTAYYWSPHAQAVFAANAGSLTIPWRRSAPSTTNANPLAGVTRVIELGVSYVVATNQYLVSGSPVKTPRLMYWTERSFVATGKPVTVPSARVGSVNVVYNNNFPERVPTEVEIPDTSQIVTSNALQELRTLWFDQTGGQAGGLIRAYNREGRVFVELLGDVTGLNTRQHLGFEIVDVVRQPTPYDVTIELGEKLTAYPNGIPSDADLVPEPLFVLGQAFTFQHNPGGSTRPTFYATRETVNQNDLLVHWLEEGLEGLRWPLRFVRCKQVWPEDVAKYSHYVRPFVATEDEAKATAVPLPSQNAPFIAYQDPLDQPRGKLTDNFSYYSFLDLLHPAHRALLRFTSGDDLRFERIFSWLENGLRERNLTLPAFVNNFAADIPGGETYGNAYLSDGILHLTDAQFNQSGSYIVDDFVGASVQNFRATFRANIGNGTAPPADGISFNFGTITSGQLLGEEGITDGLVVSWDIYDNGAGDLAPSISIKRNGATIAAVSMAEPRNPVADPGNLPVPTDPATSQPMMIATDNQFVPVEIVLNNGGLMDVSYKGVKVLANIATGYTPRTGRFGLGGRSGGGANSANWIDDLAIVVNRDAAGSIFANSVAANLNTWVGDATFLWPNESVRPRIVNATVNVGDRIGAPLGESGSGLDTNYLAGYIRQSQGTLFNPGAYLDPFTAGFDEANRGAIIPVNAMPTDNQIEVWWFRQNSVNRAQGFQNSYWPAVMGRYTVQYPTAPAEIVLASNDGSGPLLSLQAGGNIYYQNDRSQPGFNPNEEHALMQGGQAFALRDDLNVTNGATFTSLPFVLLNYTESDHRPAMRPFKVLREKPGITFDFTVPAGTVLQPPMPLPLLEKPLAPLLAGQPPTSLNFELSATTVSTSFVATAGAYTSHTLMTAFRFLVKPFEPLALQNASTPGAPVWFFPTNVAPTVLGGWVSNLRPLPLKAWSGAQNTNSARWRFVTPLPANLVAGAAPALVFDTGATSASASNSWAVTVTEVNTSSQYVELDFGTAAPPAARNANVLVMTVAGPGANGFANQRIGAEPLPNAIADATLRNTYGRFTLQDRKGNVWIYRGPHTPGESPAFAMQFYYKTLPGFYFPSLALNAQPPIGTITPYLRPTHANGAYAGNAVYGNISGSMQAADGNALGITYRPVWPANVPVLEMAETLTTTKRGLPAVRGQTSLEVAYQQSQTAGGVSHESVVLHDPTAEKTFALAAPNTVGTLDGLPGSLSTQTYLGKTYFPNLPPHLSERFFFDPNRGNYGELVFKGEFVDAPLGDDYLFLNVLGEGDRTELKALCIASDERKGRWDAAIDNLSLKLETYIENPAQPGTYIPSTATTGPTAAQTIGAGAIARIRNDDVAQDSYALTATGPGTGYISLLAGNGRAFTPEEDPVSVHVVKVVNTLYRGEVNIVESSNPLNEKLTLQQTVDLAAKLGDYQFEWKIASPVDGLPPAVYTASRVILLASGTWSHLPFPLPGDSAANVASSALGRVTNDVATLTDARPIVAPVGRTLYTAVSVEDDKFKFRTVSHRLVEGNQVALRKTDGDVVFGTVHGFTTPTNIYVTVDPNQNIPVATNEISELNERVLTNQVQSILFREFTRPAGNYSQYWLGMHLDAALGAKVYVDGQLLVTANTGNGDTAPTAPPAGLTLYSRAYRLSAADLAGGTLNADGTRTHIIAVELISGAIPAQLVTFNLRIEAFNSTDVTDQQWLPLDAVRYPDGVRAVLGGYADVRSLADNYLIMRYQPINSSHASYVANGQGGNGVWSQWTTPQLAEGWIKRVLKGINPFNQRITDLFNNSVNTDVSIVAQAGGRWEGDVALNLDNLNQAGLIEIYETVLNRGKNLSINGGINYGPANDALLLAAGYLNDLYMVLGNEAWADAANPTIGIGTAHNTYGAVATALFSFKGQLPSVLEEELALLRGRDDFLLPGVELRPVYNRMIWNYTRGIDSGEVIYALNYNILDQNTDGVVDAKDAQRLFPQGHGDAYGHYLTALKGYYALLMNNDFDWVPRIEAVTVLGQPVSVDYQDERKFAAAAGALARAGKQTFDLTWRRDFKSGTGNGWSHFAATKANLTSRNTPTTRYWGMDHWASRTGQGALLNWVVGNAILPDHDLDPKHQGSIQQVDRTTVPELKELTSVMASLQTAMDNAEAGHTPLGLPSTTIPFDLNPNSVVGGVDVNTHFEQIYTRAKRALNNAIVSFDDAKDVTRLMRSEQDSLADFRTTVNKQELAYTNALIELYGTPYPEDIGPGRTYRTPGYNGPDMLHYMYVDNVELTFTGPQGGLLEPRVDKVWRIDTQTFKPGWAKEDLTSTFGWINPAFIGGVDGTSHTEDYLSNTNLYIEYNLSAHGFFQKPATWTGRRASPGKIQQAISDIARARNAAYAAFYWADAAKYDLDWAIVSLEQKVQTHKDVFAMENVILSLKTVTDSANLAFEVYEKVSDATHTTIEGVTETIEETLPLSLIFGLAVGGDMTSAARAAVKSQGATVKSSTDWWEVGIFSSVKALEVANETAIRFLELHGIGVEQWYQELRNHVSSVRDKVYGMNNQFMTINQRLQELDDAQRKYRALLAEADRIQQEREIFRQRAAAVIQGYRTRDASFRIFRNEKLERYKTLFDLAAQYAFMAAQAYDYETGLLHTDQGREYINRIVRSRALGIVQGGEPQFAGSNTGDPGLSSALAEMFADWSVIKGRLGFNNPDAYGTTFSLRTENYRILPGTNSDTNWKDILNQARKANILDDPDVRRYCLQLDPGNGLPVPGLVLEFSTTIADQLNLFGNDLAAGDHAYSPSSFATKIFAAGVALEGYQGMDDPAANSGAGGSSPPDPNLSFLDPNMMSATPYIYMVPVGVDSMRSPPLGDVSDVRTWSVDDVTIPLPFNIGGSEFSNAQLYQSSDSLSEPAFGIRKHQAFRPVSSASVFSPNIYAGTGGLTRSQYTNNRLVGRSVWNSKWKIIIPGKTLLSNPDEGLERFIRTVKDVKLHFVTYSYSGN